MEYIFYKIRELMPTIWVRGGEGETMFVRAEERVLSQQEKDFLVSKSTFVYYNQKVDQIIIKKCTTVLPQKY